MSRDDIAASSVRAVEPAQFAPRDNDRAVCTALRWARRTTGAGIADVGHVCDVLGLDLAGATARARGEPPQCAGELSRPDPVWQWLEAYLAGQGGAALAGSAIKTGQRKGISRQRLQEARRDNGVTSRRQGTGWLWELPAAR